MSVCLSAAVYDNVLCWIGVTLVKGSRKVLSALGGILIILLKNCFVRVNRVLIIHMIAECKVFRLIGIVRKSHTTCSKLIDGFIIKL